MTSGGDMVFADIFTTSPMHIPSPSHMGPPHTTTEVFYIYVFSFYKFISKFNVMIYKYCDNVGLHPFRLPYSHSDASRDTYGKGVP
jgi:hypothetical protein